jgi:hypothetical protein
MKKINQSIFCIFVLLIITSCSSLTDEFNKDSSQGNKKLLEKINSPLKEIAKKELKELNQIPEKNNLNISNKISQEEDNKKLNQCPYFNLSILEQRISYCGDYGCSFILWNSKFDFPIKIGNGLKLYLAQNPGFWSSLSLTCKRGSSKGQNINLNYCLGLKLKETKIDNYGKITSVKDSYLTFTVNTDGKIVGVYCCKDRACWR